MTITLQDPTSQRDPSSRHAFPEIAGEPMLTASETLADELLAGFRVGGGTAETSFEVASHGGYARTVVGSVVHLDEEAQTFIVRDHDGALIRVPLRDVTSADVRAPSASDGAGSDRDADGLGTAPWRTIDTARIA